MQKSILALTIAGLLSLTATACSDASAPADQTSEERQRADSSQSYSSQDTSEQAHADQVAAETARLNQWFDEQFEAQLQNSPLRMTMLGRKDRYGEIDDVSLDAQRQQFAWLESTVEQLQNEFDYDLLDADAQISYDIWMFQYELAREGQDFLQAGYVFDQMRGAHSSLPQLLLAYHGVDSESDMQAYNSRIRGIGQAIQTLTEQAQSRAENDIRPPRFAYQHVLRQSQALITGAPFDDGDASPIYADGVSKIESLYDNDEINEEAKNELISELEAALVEAFKPAYQGLISWLESDLENTEQNTVGISRHENGNDFYEYMLKVSTTTDLSAAEIHQIGLDEVARITEEMNEIRQQVGFEGDLQAFFEFIRTDEQFFFPNNDEGAEMYLEQSREYLDAIADRLPDFFGRLPKADLVVRRVEPFREQDGAPQHYYPGSPDGSRPGVYYAHLSDMRSMAKNEMEAIAYHEGNPGHHMQISIAQELDDVPQFRTQARFTVYSEGWALYSELLAKEMGGYEDPYSDFGRLVTEMWRAIRLVVDTGLHAKDWTEEQAVAFFQEHSPIPEGAVRSEVQRYLVMPGQATSYKIGMIKIQELRAEAEDALGDNFDIRGFHDTVLGGGAMPLPILERQVRNWIATQQAG
ncbi:DUF885 domain-containing protein [Aliidiomarina maris]|uniref:DUF885 domain-containing protein n=1 Tax=Aliidiomarina maris TaxID=531312 RepID=A0A327WUB5_9GAMM|nr:DUF885 domain-containing protein [Aliidiomarina maris]RAJ95276.1 uncharacterized protein (DUF885 family) [Aliidiomarina maris]RUO21030.1 DUF885 domain-containing protein [Aliidiomarina maris]